MSPIRVMLVDDHTVLRAGLRMLINNQADMEVVSEAEKPAEILPRANDSHPDVVVLDLSLPGGSTLPLIDVLGKLEHVPRVLVLTMHDDPAYVRAALSTGAVGFIVKTVGENDLLQAIRSVMRGQIVIDLDDEIRTAEVFLAVTTGTSGRLPKSAKLSTRELEVLRLLGHGNTNQAVADLLELSPKTVATYRARIGEKLGLKTTPEFVRYAVDMGLVTPEH